MKRQTRLNTGQKAGQDLQASQTEQTSETAREFATPEELLRHDALHTPVPPSIARRLKESLGPLTPPSSSWWRKFFGS
jgi:hypothetical protein